MRCSHFFCFGKVDGIINKHIDQVKKVADIILVLHDTLWEQATWFWESFSSILCSGMEPMGRRTYSSTTSYAVSVVAQK